MMEKERIIVPCMDNKVLLLYMPNIKEIILLDEACDDPHDMNWDPNVTIRNVPLAIYEALDDYIYLDDNDSRKDKISDKFTNYGSLFIGSNCAEVFGDYCSGTNHVLPTNSAARYTGGLSVFDFIKIQTYQMISKDYAKELSSLAS